MHTCFHSIHINYFCEIVWNCCVHNKMFGVMRKSYQTLSQNISPNEWYYKILEYINYSKYFIFTTKERSYLKISHIIFLDHLLLRKLRTLLAQLLIKKRKRMSNQLLMTMIVIKNNLWINLIRRLRKKVSIGFIFNFQELFPVNKIIWLINRNKQIDPTNQFVYFFNLT